MTEYIFTIQGSQPEPYVVTFTRTGNKLIAICTCVAGVNRQYCKHRFNLLHGDVTALLSGNADDVKELPAMLAGTNVEAAMGALAAAEEIQRQVTKEVANCKRTLAHAMSG